MAWRSAPLQSDTRPNTHLRTVLIPYSSRGATGHAGTRVVLDCYGHMFEGARRQAAETMDCVFNDLEIGRQEVVKKAASLPDRTVLGPQRSSRYAFNSHRGLSKET